MAVERLRVELGGLLPHVAPGTVCAMAVGSSTNCVFSGCPVVSASTMSSLRTALVPLIS